MLKCPRCNTQIEAKWAYRAPRDNPMQCGCGERLWFRTPSGLGLLFVVLFAVSLSIADLFGTGPWLYGGILVSGIVLTLVVGTFLEIRFGKMVDEHSGAEEARLN